MKRSLRKSRVYRNIPHVRCEISKPALRGVARVHLHPALLSTCITFTCPLWHVVLGPAHLGPSMNTRPLARCLVQTHQLVYRTYTHSGPRVFAGVVFRPCVKPCAHSLSFSSALPLHQGANGLRQRSWISKRLSPLTCFALPEIKKL